ncbi:endo-1,4-beta-xylanase [soil metagenome]
MHKPLLFAFSIIAALTCAHAGNSIPPGGSSIIAPAAFTTSPKMLGTEFGSMAIEPVTGMPFSKVMRVTTTTRPEKEYAIQAKVFTTAPIQKGDALLVSFYARSTGSGNNDTGLGLVSMAVQTKQPMVLIGKYQATPGADWQQYFCPMDAKGDAPAGNAFCSFSFGAQLQTIEIGDVQVLNYGHSKTINDLPKTEITYDGREPNAAWRQAAEQRIEKNRKGDLTVVVKDVFGHLIPNATVQVDMTKHAFNWGAAVTSRAFENSAAAKPILENHKQLFNQGVPITYFVWPILETQEGKDGANKILKYFNENGIASRAHVLVWERSDHFPADVQQMLKNGEKQQLHDRIASHIRDTVKTYKGRVNEWVVENEAVDNSEIRDALGENSIAEWFKIARETDPTARLMINENRVEGLKPDKSDRLLHLVDLVEKNGGKIDTIGIQGHFGSIPVPPETLLKHYDKLAATGKQLAITEYDFASEDEQLKADYTRDIMTAVFSEPSFNCFTIWRFWDGKPEKRESVIFANDWTLRPSGQVYKDLVFGKWWTKVTGKTDAAGKFSTRGFLGDYRITVTGNGKTGSVSTTLRKGAPDVVEVTLK